ncbi:MAG: hypothetical protein SGILL_000868 [Bacillariaceae sp.]
MSGLDDGYHDNVVEADEEYTPQLPLLKPRKSMDMEFHDLNLDGLEEDSDRTAPTSKQNALGRNQSNHGPDDSDWSSDDDSFGEASDDCEPDKQYLEELLDEEYHPERLNLLHNYTPSQKKKKNIEEEDSPRGNGVIRPKYDMSDSDSEAERVLDTTDDESDLQGSPRSIDSDMSDSHRQHDFDLSDHEVEEDENESENDVWISGGGNSNSESGSGTAEGQNDGDAFEGSPMRMRDPDRPTLKKQLESMGKSTKKSFRTVGNKSFFSQPFKGLARSLSGGKRRKKQSLSLEGQQVI